MSKGKLTRRHTLRQFQEAQNGSAFTMNGSLLFLYRSMDVDAILSETAFMENSKVRAREMLCPGW